MLQILLTYCCKTVILNQLEQIKGYKMSHYADLEAAKAYNERLEKKYSFNRTVPMGNTADLFRERNTIDDALGFCESPCLQHQEIAKVADKETRHKAEGARYCYLSSIACASNYAGCAEEQIGAYLDKLLDFDFSLKCSTQHIFNMIITYCGIAIGDDKDLWDGVIAVRNYGLESGKYSANNHKLPMDKNLLLDAAARHLIAYLYISHIDDESGESHLCHIVANILMFAAQLNIEKGE